MEVCEAEKRICTESGKVCVHGVQTGLPLLHNPVYQRIEVGVKGGLYLLHIGLNERHFIRHASGEASHKLLTADLQIGKDASCQICRTVFLRQNTKLLHKSGILCQQGYSGLQFRVCKPQFVIQALSVRVDGVHIVSEVTDRITGKELLEAAYNAVPSDTAHRVSIGTDLPGKSRHEIHKIGHIIGKLGKSAV